MKNITMPPNIVDITSKKSKVIFENNCSNSYIKIPSIEKKLCS